MFATVITREPEADKNAMCCLSSHAIAETNASQRKQPTQMPNQQIEVDTHSGRIELRHWLCSCHPPANPLNPLKIGNPSVVISATPSDNTSITLSCVQGGTSQFLQSATSHETGMAVKRRSQKGEADSDYEPERSATVRFLRIFPVHVLQVSGARRTSTQPRCECKL